MNNRNTIITDSEADRSITLLETGQVVPAPGFSRWMALKNTTRHDNSHLQSPDDLSRSKFELILAVVNNPMRPSSDYVKLAGVSPNTLRKLRPILIEKGFIREHLVQANKRGRCTRLWEPLERAKEISDQNRT